MTGDFRRIVWTIAHLPASACTTSAPGSKSPLGRGGGGGAARIGVLPGFPVVGVRLCEDEPDALHLEPGLKVSYGEYDGPLGSGAHAAESTGFYLSWNLFLFHGLASGAWLPHSDWGGETARRASATGAPYPQARPTPRTT